MKLIETKTLGTAAASIEFTSIPQTFTDLVLLSSLRDATVQESAGAGLTFNSNTSNRSGRQLVGFGNSTGSFVLTNFMIGGRVNGAGSTANTFASSSLYIPNYAGSNQKSSSLDDVAENNATASIQEIVAQLWADTAAITSITVTANSGNFVVGSTISLYGILKGSDGIVTTS